MELLRYSAFAEQPLGGNPAGVVLDAQGMSEADMLSTAADVGYSETAFLLPRGEGEYDVRYFSPEAEVSFCGHATVAAAVALADRAGGGDLKFHTKAGLVPVSTRTDESGTRTDESGTHATLTTLPTSIDEPSDLDVASALMRIRFRQVVALRCADGSSRLPAHDHGVSGALRY